MGEQRLYRALSQRVKEKAHSIFTVNKIIENYIVGSFISILIFVFSNFLFFCSNVSYIADRGLVGGEFLFRFSLNIFFSFEKS